VYEETVERMTVNAQRSGLGCGNIPMSDPVALDVMPPIFGADVSGEHLESALGSGIA